MGSPAFASFANDAPLPPTVPRSARESDKVNMYWSFMMFSFIANANGGRFYRKKN
jgi:hypothetical protein